MDSKLILAAARGTLDGSLSFPEVVGKLLAAGVEYYHVNSACASASSLPFLMPPQPIF